MELALLVYVISLLQSVDVFFKLCIFALVLVSAVLGIYLGDSGDKMYYNDKENTRRAASAVNAKKWLWRNIWIAIASAWVIILLPSEKTAYTMVGAYAAQKIAQDPKTEQMGSKVLVIINQKLDEYIDEGISKAKQTINDKVSK
jgi:hypothetical protein